MEYVSRSQENVFGNPRSIFESSQTPYQGILHSATPSATGGVPVDVSTPKDVNLDIIIDTLWYKTWLLSGYNLTHVTRLEVESAHHGFVESRREQVRLQES